MRLFLVGLNHRTAPLELLERFCLPSERQLALLAPPAQAAPGFYEAALLATCNRAEAYAVAGEAANPRALLTEGLARAAGVPVTELERALYTAEDEAAVSHLFDVAAGLDSMVVGEWQILGQVQDAYVQARRAGAAGIVLRALFRAAVAAGRRVRMASGVGRDAASIGSAAVALAERDLGSLAGRRAVLVGSGQMAELVTEALCARGVRGAVVVNRHPDRARPMARALAGQALDFLHLERALTEADFAIAATGAPHAVLTAETLARVMRARDGRPLLVLDIALPRDVEPAAARLPGLRLHDLGSLQSASGAPEPVADGDEVRRARALVTAEALRFSAWFHSARATPMLLALRQRAELIRERELQRALRRLPNLDGAERETVALLTQTLVNRLLREPTVRLREEAARGNGQLAGAVRQLFALEEATG